MSHYSRPLHGGTAASRYAANYDHGPRRTHRYAEGALYGASYGIRPMIKYPVSSRYRKKESNVLFESAMEQLYNTLEDAVDFFKDFDTSFANDTDAIKSYAAPAILDELWKNKIISLEKSGKSRSGRRPSNDGWGNSDDSSNSQIEGSFQEHLKHVHDDMSDAIYSRMPSGARGEHGESVSGFDIDSMNRLREKLSVQYEALHRISGKIYKVRSYLHEFTKESELILVYMDKSRELWQPDGIKEGKDKDSGFQDDASSGEGGFGS